VGSPRRPPPSSACPRGRRSSRRPATRRARRSVPGRSSRTSARSHTGRPRRSARPRGATSRRSPSSRRIRRRSPARGASSPGLSRLLDGRLVQAPVRQPRGRPGGAARGASRGALRRSHPRHAAGFDGPPPPADLVARHPHPRPGGERSDHRLRRRPTPAPISIARSSRALPTRCGRAASEPRSGPGRRSASCGSSGGGAQSPAAVHLTADIFGLPTGRPHTHETSGLGAAIDAAVGLGIHGSFGTAVAEMTRVAEMIDPDRIRNELYDDLYERVYRRMYARLKPLYEEIREITGYPPH